jgi:hypothetical protein
MFVINIFCTFLDTNVLWIRDYIMFIELDDVKHMLFTPLCCHVFYCLRFSSHIFDTI